jgi:hypothetical protein
MGCQCIKRDPNDMIILEINNNPEKNDNDVFNRKFTYNSKREKLMKLRLSEDYQTNQHNTNVLKQGAYFAEMEDVDRTGTGILYYESNDISMTKSMKSKYYHNKKI